MEPHRTWIEQSDATGNILNHFGIQPALHYLVGEKFLDFLEAAESDRAFQSEVPEFAARVKQIFAQPDLTEYLTPSLHATRDAARVNQAREWLVET